MEIDYKLIIYATLVWLGRYGLYSLRNWKVKDSFRSNGFLIGFATLIEKVDDIAITAFIVIAIIKDKWYSPFLYLAIGYVSSMAIERILFLVKLSGDPPKKTKTEIFIRTAILCVSLFLLLTYYF